MTLKSKMSVLVLLTSVSIVSIGFSSWSITTETNAEIGGNIEVDNIISSDDFIKLDTSKGDNNTGIIELDYNENGYINTNGFIGSKGHMVAYFKIDLKECKSFFVEHNSLSIDLTLKYDDSTPSDYNMFLQSSRQSITPTFSDSDIKANKTSSNSATYLSYNLLFEKILYNYDSLADKQYYYFSVDYLFFATISGGYYANNIYPCLYADKVKFSLTLTIQGSN